MILEQSNTTSSKMIKRFVYNFKDQKLKVTFNNEVTYEYEDVPESMYDDMCKAEGHGRFFIRNIKDVFKYKKLD